MIAANQKSNGYSAVVEMELRVNGHVFRIGQLAPDFIILRDAVDLPPSQGEITVSIDGHINRWPVWLPEGASPAKVRCPIQR
jgi:hypothetical protein